MNQCSTQQSGVLFVQKPTKEGEEVKLRLVLDLKRVNPNLSTIGNPLDGSAHILRRLESDETLFGAIDLSSGNHQVTIHTESTDLFTIILPTGR